MQAHATLNNVQMLRAVAVLIVVAFHIEPYLMRIDADYSKWVNRFGYSGVDLFFVISGFINSYVSVGKWGNASYSWRFLAKRLIRIVPNYWLILLPTAYLVYQHGMRPIDTVDPIASFVLFIPQHLTDHILIPAWTLNYELFFYMALAVLMLRPKWMLHVFTAWFVLVAVLQYWLDYANTDFVWAFTFSAYWLQFIAGVWIGHLAHNSSMPFARCLIGFGCLMFGVAIWMNTVIYPEGFANPFHRDLRAWLYLLAYAPLVYGLVSLEKHKQWICSNRIMLGLGDASYSIYLWMTAYLFAFYHITAHYLAVNSWPLGAFAVASTVSLLVFVWYYYRWVERPMIERLKRWML